MKKCFKCDRILPLSEYYTHPGMADGHLGKCKSCTKGDTAARVSKKKLDPEWVVAEAGRHRKKQAEYRLAGTAVVLSGEKKALVLKKHAEKYPEKAAARRLLGNAVRDGKVLRKPCEVCGNPDSEAHHDDYSKPLDVIWFCPKHHSERHVFLRDQQRRARANALACSAVMEISDP